ncbi:FadR/GntR family transcriptional regulator [Ferrovibrio sp.]|uniref:FadR/GntR family transcriptional regulator n=1 Tax=Ferrovibrio sp. TaxID=1917215 RepID=UPI00311E55D0
MSDPNDKPFSMSPIAARNLTAELVERLSGEILAGKLPPGSKLPTEQEMVAATGVSRTVVREAVAALRAEGLVITRQGVGAFVAADIDRRPYRIDEASLDVVQEVINVLELRAGLEAEAAALAAERRNPSQLAAMRAALDRMAAAIEDAEDAVAPDLDFHRTVAEATGNPQFTHLFSYLGSLLIPRARVQTFQSVTDDRSAYLRRVNQEHEDIYAAIQRQDAAAARAAMRLHLGNSRERLRRAMESASQQTSSPGNA